VPSRSNKLEKYMVPKQRTELDCGSRNKQYPRGVGSARLDQNEVLKRLLGQKTYFGGNIDF